MLPINDISRKFFKRRAEIDASFKRVIDSGWVVLGPEVERFEKKFASYTSVEHCISVANGTDALEIALKALGVVEGDLVGTVANAGMYTSTAVLSIGAIPHFMDVSYDTCLVLDQEVTKAIQAGVKAIVITHLYGRAVPSTEQIVKLCHKHNVFVVEDCAQAHGATINGKHVGGFGDASAYSFYPTKNLGAIGDGGAVLTNSQNVAMLARQLRQYGWSEKYYSTITGARNSRLDEIQAAFLTLFLDDLQSENKERVEVSNYYKKNISNSAVSLPQMEVDCDVVHLYVLKSKYRDELLKYLNDNGVAAMVHYPIPDYKQPSMLNKHKNVFLENTDRLCNEIMTLPCFPGITLSELRHVVDLINAWQPPRLD